MGQFITVFSVEDRKSNSADIQLGNDPICHCLHASHPIHMYCRGYRIHLISDIIHLTRQWCISKCRSVYDPFYIPLSFPNLHRHILLVQPYNVALYCSKSIQRHLSGENPRRMFSNPDSFQLQLSSSRNCPSQTIETFNVLCCSLAGW